MLSIDLLLGVCLAYVVLLFGVAFLVDRRARKGPMNWLRSPVIYTLSISVYCTSWTFYGAVGQAARNGLEFITIYLGPTLVFIGWWWLLRKLVRIGRAHRITSIADLISSRYGKSPSLAVLVTLIALIATTPYIALQLQSMTRAYQIIAGGADTFTTAFWIAAGMALFAILFGTRNLDANERHHGVVAAIALEAIIKLLALLAVGIFAVYGVAGGLQSVFADVTPEMIRGSGDIFGLRWVVLTFLSATAIICLPRQFQVTVVENIDERHMATASWLFPLYLLGMTLFIMPIALVGLKTLPVGANPDLFVLTLPLIEGRSDLALLAFLGGFSSATSMVIVATIAVSTMVSNHIVMPVVARLLAMDHGVHSDVRNLLLSSRRISIAVILGLGLLYFHLSGGSDALAAIGLIAFVGVAQFLPGVLGGLFWVGATRSGAFAGLSVGAIFWAYCLFLPSFGGAFILSESVIMNGPFGLDILRPQAFMGLEGLDPLVHAVVWSVGSNALVFIIVSVLTEADTLERLQGSLFVNIFRTNAGQMRESEVSQADSEDLFILAQRILGPDPARRLFDEIAEAQGTSDALPAPTDRMILSLERELAGSIGAASAHAMVSRIAGRENLDITALINIADEAQQLIETSRQLSEKSAEFERAASQLSAANVQLRALDSKKDEFLSQVSHELRTPMTSIRSFSEILLDTKSVSADDQKRFLSIINSESQRLTRLLDEILDIGRFESGDVKLDLQKTPLEQPIQAALDSLMGIIHKQGIAINQDNPLASASVLADPDRLQQVLINILSNAVKYNKAPDPAITIRTRQADEETISIDIIDNGGGVSREEASVVFGKFVRGKQSARGQGAGLGLPISRAMMQAMKGDLTIVFEGKESSFFRISLQISAS